MIKRIVLGVALLAFPAFGQSQLPIQPAQSSLGWVIPQGGTVGDVISNQIAVHVQNFANGATPCVADGNTDCTTAINNAFNYVLNGAGNCGQVIFDRGPGGAGGGYKVTSDIVVDIGTATNNCKSDGLKIIFPEGGLDLIGTSITTTPTLEIRCTGNSCNNLYLGPSRLTVKGANTGPVFVLGKSDLSDSFIGGTIDYIIPQNFSANASAAGAQINSVSGANLRFALTFNSGGGGSSGYGIELNNVSASVIDTGQISWGSGKALYLTNGTNKGNTILGFLCGGSSETGITSDSANNQSNTFVNPYFSGCATDVASSAGTGNILLNPVFIGTKYSGATGFVEVNPNPAYTSPAPSSGTTVNMTTPQTTQTQSLILRPAAGLAALTITTPACNLSADGFSAMVGTSQAITAVTWAAASGAVSSSAPSTFAAGGGVILVCRGGEGVWYPV